MDLKGIFEQYFKNEMLTEDVQKEIETLFEAAVNAKTQAKLEEQGAASEERAMEKLAEFKEELVQTLSDYMEETFGEWFETNETNIVSDIKVNMAESTMKKLQGVLADNFIEIKEEEINVVEDLESKLDETKTKLDEVGNHNIDLKKQIIEYQKAVQFTTLTGDLTESETETLLTLIESIECKDVDEFVSKATLIKSNINQISESVGEIEEAAYYVENPDAVLSEKSDDAETVNALDKYLPVGARV